MRSCCRASAAGERVATGEWALMSPGWSDRAASLTEPFEHAYPNPGIARDPCRRVPPPRAGRLFLLPVDREHLSVWGFVPPAFQHGIAGLVMHLSERGSQVLTPPDVGRSADPLRLMATRARRLPTISVRASRGFGVAPSRTSLFLDPDEAVEVYLRERRSEPRSRNWVSRVIEPFGANGSSGRRDPVVATIRLARCQWSCDTRNSCPRSWVNGLPAGAQACTVASKGALRLALVEKHMCTGLHRPHGAQGIDGQSISDASARRGRSPRGQSLLTLQRSTTWNLSLVRFAGRHSRPFP